MAYTADLTSGSTPTVSSTAAGNAAQTIDDNTGTEWSAASSANEWVKIDFGAGVTYAITKLRIFPLLDTVSRIKDWSLKGSNNDSSYTEVTTGQVTQYANTWEAFEFANTTKYRYYRLDLINTWGGGANFVDLYEIEMMETLSPGGGFFSLF
jgi:large repetitive protein